LTYYYGEQMAVGFWHEFSGWLVFVAGFVLLVLVNFALNKFNRRESGTLREMDQEWPTVNQPSAIRNQKIVVLLMTLLIGGVFINWFERRGELPTEHLSLHELPVELGAWQQKGEDTRFSAESESVLRASDYVMRNYFLPSGRRGNLYIGYYASQRSGATYHSPLNCLPGSGWEMHSPELVEIKTPAGKTLLVNRYIVQNGNYRAFLIYWYQGRGRVLASEYQDKFYTVLDSVLKRRSDGAMVRVMTAVGENEAESRQAAIDLASQVADQITPFVPD
jgi:EpsI family protein